MSRNHQTRGQALVLFALFLLVLVLATMATMSLAHLTHQKMELQVSSDTAAYSQAVATARAYNSVALLNRAQVATMVALSGVDSAVSFAGSYRAALNATWYGYVNELQDEYCGDKRKPSNPTIPTKICGGNYTFYGSCNFASHGMDSFDRQNCYGDSGNGEYSSQATRKNTCEAWLNIFGWGAVPPSTTATYSTTARMPLMRDEFDRIKGVWQALDDAAGLQGRSVQEEAVAYNGLQADALAAAFAKLEPFATTSVAASGGTLNGASLGIAQREYNDGYSGGEIDNSLEDGMGSRAHPFITQRIDGARALQDQIHRVLAPSGASPAEVVVQPLLGNGYFATAETHGAKPASTFATWGDEHSTITVNYLGPGANAGQGNTGSAAGNLRFEGWVRSTDLQNTADSHDWCPTDFQPEAVPPDERHTLLRHTAPPAGQADPCAASSCIWPAFHDANADLIALEPDVYGQPKLFATATKDLAAQSDPWNLFFKFRFAQSGAGSQTDLRAEHALKFGGGITPQMQSLSAGMAYYHRPGHWKEPPNMFNPYWRASLVRANVDATWKADIGASVSPSNKATLLALDGAGFLGIP